MSATTSTSDTTSPKNRPDEHPEPETDGYNAILGEMRDSYVQLARATSKAEFARAIPSPPRTSRRRRLTNVQTEFRSNVGLWRTCFALKSALHRRQLRRPHERVRHLTRQPRLRRRSHPPRLHDVAARPRSGRRDDAASHRHAPQLKQRAQSTSSIATPRVLVAPALHDRADRDLRGKTRANSRSRIRGRVRTRIRRPQSHDPKTSTTACPKSAPTCRPPPQGRLRPPDPRSQSPSRREHRSRAREQATRPRGASARRRPRDGDTGAGATGAGATGADAAGADAAGSDAIGSDAASGNFTEESSAFIEDPRTIDQLRADLFLETILQQTRGAASNPRPAARCG